MESKKRKWTRASSFDMLEGGHSVIGIFAVQCEECSKWRVIPSQEEYEEIRFKLKQDPFVCSKRPGITCNDPTDLERDGSRAWAIDKANLPKTPSGFTRAYLPTKDLTKIYCLFIAPDGRKLRNLSQVAAYLKDKPEYEHISPEDFSFKPPRVYGVDEEKNGSTSGTKA